MGPVYYIVYGLPYLSTINREVGSANSYYIKKPSLNLRRMANTEYLQNLFTEQIDVIKCTVHCTLSVHCTVMYGSAKNLCPDWVAVFVSYRGLSGGSV
jgi:hypothetical protein